MNFDMMEHMVDPQAQGDINTNPFAASMQALNEDEMNNANMTEAERLEAGKYELPSIDGKAYDSDNQSSSQLKGNIDNMQVNGSKNNDNIESNQIDSMPAAIVASDTMNNQNTDTTQQNATSVKDGEFAKEESSFVAGVWHPMKCYTHKILKLHGTRFYIHWSFIALAVIYLIFSIVWPGNLLGGTVHLWIAFRVISPVFYFINLMLLSIGAIWITKAKFKVNHYYFVLFCFGVFNRLRTDITEFKPRMMYYSLIPVLHFVFAMIWWIFAALAGGDTLGWSIDNLDTDFMSKCFLYQRNLNILCLLMAALPMPSTFGGCIYASLLQYKRGWSVTKACVLLVLCSIICLVLLTFLWIVNLSEIELLLVVAWSSWQLLEFIFKGKESSGMKSMILTSVATHAIQQQTQQMTQQMQMTGNVSGSPTQNVSENTETGPITTDQVNSAVQAENTNTITSSEVDVKL